MSDLVQQLIDRADAAYWQGNPLLSDLAYDTLRDAINSPVDSIGPRNPQPAQRSLRAPMLSLDKADRTTLPTFLGTIGAGELIIEPKVDGIALELHYSAGTLTHAATRGNGHGGMDLTDLIAATPYASIRTTEELTVHAELYVTDAALHRISRTRRQYTSPRAAIGSIINAANRADYAKELAIAVHDVIPSQGETDIRQAYNRAARAGLPILPHLAIPARDVSLDTMRKFFTAALADFPADGIVLKTPSLRTRRALGATATAPRWAIAVKDYLLA